jgi:hypothetical protein
LSIPKPVRQVDDLGDQVRMSREASGVPLEQRRYGVDEERQENTVGAGEVKRVPQRLLGGGAVAERVARDRFEQERLDEPSTEGHC